MNGSKQMQINPLSHTYKCKTNQLRVIGGQYLRGFEVFEKKLLVMVLWLLTSIGFDTIWLQEKFYQNY